LEFVRTPPPPSLFCVHCLISLYFLGSFFFLLLTSLYKKSSLSFSLTLYTHTQHLSRDISKPTFCSSLSLPPPSHFVCLSLHPHNTSFERSVSTEAKTLIRGLLTEDVIQRFTIEDTRKDPWLVHIPDRLPVPSPKKLRK
jgi:serine/threonine protein kinase